MLHLRHFPPDPRESRRDCRRATWHGRLDPQASLTLPTPAPSADWLYRRETTTCRRERTQRPGQTETLPTRRELPWRQRKQSRGRNVPKG
eukprot:1227462-Rhodomonas_salina.6